MITRLTSLVFLAATSSCSSFGHCFLLDIWLRVNIPLYMTIFFYTFFLYVFLFTICFFQWWNLWSSYLVFVISLGIFLICYFFNAITLMNSINIALIGEIFSEEFAYHVCTVQIWSMSRLTGCSCSLDDYFYLVIWISYCFLQDDWLIVNYFMVSFNYLILVAFIISLVWSEKSLPWYYFFTTFAYGPF